MRFDLSKIMLLCLIPALLMLLPGCGENIQKPPIILISIDTLRADHLGCYGYHRPTSPNIDRFAQTSVLFRDAFASAPVTAPSHMSIFTGLSPVVHGVINFHQEEGSERARARQLSEKIPTLPEFLQQNGYLTVALTAGGNISEKMGFGRGFDHFSTEFEQWVDENGVYRTGVEDLPRMKKTVQTWINQARNQDQPIFLFFHHNVCHDPYLSGPTKYRMRFLDNPVKGLPAKADEFKDAQDFGDVRGKFFAPLDPSNPEHIRHYMDLYDGGILFSDLIFQNLLDALKEEGIADHALIILLSDHGEEFFEHQGKLHWKLFRETIRVPLIIRFPLEKWGGQDISVPVRLTDIFPTIANLLGLTDKLPQIQGESLLPLMENRAGYNPDPVSFSGNARSVRIQRDGYTYLNQVMDQTRHRLFAHQDSGEASNLAETKSKTLKVMKKEAAKIMLRHKELRRKLVGPEALREIEADASRMEQLRALGYVN